MVLVLTRRGAGQRNPIENDNPKSEVRKNGNSYWNRSGIVDRSSGARKPEPVEVSGYEVRLVRCMCSVDSTAK